MKVIDLLNKIANGEKVPRIVKHHTLYWEYNEKNKDFKDNEDDWVFSCSNYDLTEMLNDEVEIIEEDKKIEKIDHLIGYDIRQFEDLREYVEITTSDLFGKTNKIIDKINEIIEEINRMENE